MDAAADEAAARDTRMPPVSAPEPPAMLPLVLLTERRTRSGGRALQGWLGEARLLVVETDRTDPSGSRLWQIFLAPNTRTLERTVRREGTR